MVVDMSPTQRWARLLAGIALFGLSIGMLVRADLGLGPWDVLHQGIAGRTGIPIGGVVVALSALVLALGVPLRQRPGIGTVANVVLVGVALDASLAILPTPGNLGWRVGLLLAGVLLNGLAIGLYISAGMGPGPRDGLMTGLAARGHSIRRARTAIEVVVLLLGWLLGGAVGVGTVVYALAIGPLAQRFIPADRSGPAPVTADPRG
jgi:uncharacterized membrane protein YczE